MRLARLFLVACGAAVSASIVSCRRTRVTASGTPSLTPLPSACGPPGELRRGLELFVLGPGGPRSARRAASSDLFVGIGLASLAVTSASMKATVRGDDVGRERDGARPSRRRSPLKLARFALASAVSTLTFYASSLAWACPSCPVGRSARTQVLEQDFGTNLVIALVPFLLVGLVARWAERLRTEAPARDQVEEES